jgi:hypothetical protein
MSTKRACDSSSWPAIAILKESLGSTPAARIKSDGTATSWLKIKHARYSQAEGRAELFEQRRSPERRTRRKAPSPTLVLG